MICILCKKETEGTLGPSKTRIPVCRDCTPDRRQRTSRDSTNYQDPHRICPDCKGRKGWDSLRCASCATKRVKKIDPARKICPRCQGPKEPTSGTCQNCYHNIRHENRARHFEGAARAAEPPQTPDPLENSKEDQALQEKTP